MDDNADKIIRAILKRGNDVQIQRKGDGYVILEVSRIIRAVKQNEQVYEKHLRK